MVRLLGRLVYPQPVLNAANSVIEVGVLLLNLPNPSYVALERAAPPPSQVPRLMVGLGHGDARVRAHQELFSDPDPAVRASAHEAWRCAHSTALIS